MVKYETAVPIGRGAYGEVFKAWDPEHHRTIALKLFPTATEADPGDAAERRQREAEAQQRLDHPSICEIYDVGTTPGGRGYIAMRHVDGEPLDRAAERLPLRERVALIREIADAVACAHRAGLIHRDLKPSNLLVERQAQGELRPFVLDFGIVRMADRTRLTETGQVLGTPGYLSPEQARGDCEIDARSDVFSLGVILYEVLTGENPFATGSGAGALVRVLDHDPPPAHSVAAGIPPELGHIARKAMEKDPRRRYVDAAALCRDLDNFLRADVVSAREVGRLGRLVRRIERQPGPWLVGLALGLVAIGSLTWSLRESLSTARQARQAERFARRSSEIVAQLRFLELLPEHPIGEGRERLGAELAALAREVAESKGRARAGGAYAVGRGELALGRPAAAIETLSSARESGFGDPSGALALARAHLEQARVDLQQVDQLADPKVRAAERQRLREELRARSLPLLEEASVAAAGDRSEKELAQALVAFLLDRGDEAIRLASALVERDPWRIEADAIRADTERERAAAARNEDRPADAMAALVREQGILEAALQRAPSAPALHERRCGSHLLYALVELASRRPQAAWEASFDRAEAACAQALRVLPTARRPAALRVELGWRRALERMRRHGAAAVIGDLEGLVAAAEEQCRLAPDDAGSHFNLGNARFALADAWRQLGLPSGEGFEQAAAALAAGLEHAPGSAFGWQSLGHAWSRLGLVGVAAAEDPRLSYRRAIDAYTRGMLGSNVRRSRMENGICVAHTEIAYYGVQHPAEVAPGEVAGSLAAGVAACRSALERDPQYLPALSNLALAHWTEMEWRIHQGMSPLAAAEQAEASFRRLLALDPEHVSGRNNFAGMVASFASWSLEQDDRPIGELLPTLEEAQEVARPLVERFPADALLHLARLTTLEAAVLCRSDAETSGVDRAFEEAREAVTSLDGLQTVQKDTAVRKAELRLRVASCAHHRGDSARAEIEARSGLQAIEEALALDPGFAEARNVRDQLRSLAGDLSAESG